MHMYPLSKFHFIIEVAVQELGVLCQGVAQNTLAGEG